MRIAIAAAAAAALLLAGCAGETYEFGRFSLAGKATVNVDRTFTFRRSRDFSQPSGFALTPEGVATKFGQLCKAKKSCSYFADSRAYYLVADYGEAGARRGSISQIACPVVDGRSGSLLRIC